MIMNTEYQHLSQYFAAARKEAEQLQLQPTEVEQLLQRASIPDKAAEPTRVGGYWSKNLLTQAVGVASFVLTSFVVLIVTFYPSEETNKLKNGYPEQPVATVPHNNSQSEVLPHEVVPDNVFHQQAYKTGKQQEKFVFRFRYLELTESELERLSVVLCSTETAFQQPTRVGTEHVEPQKRFLSFPMMVNSSIRRGKLRWWTLPQQRDSLPTTGGQNVVSLTLAEELPLKDALLPVAISQPNGVYYSLPLTVQSDGDKLNSNELIPILIRVGKGAEALLWYRLSEPFIANFPDRLRSELNILQQQTPPAGVTRNNRSVLHVTLHPHPIIDEAIVHFELAAALAVTAEIYDLQGKLLLKQASPGVLRMGKQEIRLSCSALEPGIYNLVLRLSSGTYYSSTMVVNK